MTLARLLAALMICSLPAFTQDQAQTSPPPSALLALASNSNAPAAASEPWRVVPIQPQDIDPATLRIGQYKADYYQLDNRGKVFLPYRIGWSGDPSSESANNDKTCYSIRSYVVARDSKDSDSTHPAGYSTCLPSDRYRVKSAEIRVGSANQ